MNPATRAVTPTIIAPTGFVATAALIAVIEVTNVSLALEKFLKPLANFLAFLVASQTLPAKPTMPLARLVTPFTVLFATK